MRLIGILVILSWLTFGCSETSTTSEVPIDGGQPIIDSATGYWKGSFFSKTTGRPGEAHLLVDASGVAYLFYAQEFTDFIQYYTAKGSFKNNELTISSVYTDNASNPYTPGLTWSSVGTIFSFKLITTEKDNISGSYISDDAIGRDFGDVTLFYQDIQKQPWPTTIHSNNYQIICGSVYECTVAIEISLDSKNVISGSYLTKDFYNNFTPLGSGDFIQIFGSVSLSADGFYNVDIDFGSRKLTGKGVSINGVLYFIATDSDETFAISLISKG